MAVCNSTERVATFFYMLKMQTEYSIEMCERKGKKSY